MVMQRQRYPGLAGATPPMSSVVSPQTARPPVNPSLPTIQGATRLNPDGSAAPSLGAAQQGGGGNTLNVPSNPLTGLAATLAGGQPQAEMLLGDPGALTTALAQQMGIDPYAGLVDLVSGIGTTDQLDTLIALLAATQDVPTDAGNQLGAVGGLLQGMLSGSGQQMPNISQVLGPVAGMGNRGDPNNPLYGLLTGGNPAQQSGQLLAAVMDLAGLSGMNDLQARGLASRLNALSREYVANQARPNAGGGEAFINWLMQRAPSVSHTIFGT